MAQTKGKATKQADRLQKSTESRAPRRLKDLGPRDAAKVKGGRSKHIIPCV